ncbi:hypothetical protein H072_9662 [Dactylellina haptotyla CBS 200.50]|uniref:FAD-binding PCMH-type domain-containing protein n=1 Tax=Dactylellina haptotyla (strain CBS 200.50) TaxID=1284197 RepID=S8A6R1_DACHA|nr:hypothetical protein H072_9662 [Dactylellina haptotyla CBS 200.50]
MRLPSLAILLLLRVSATCAVYTLSEVQMQVEAYHEQTSTIAPRTLPSRCWLLCGFLSFTLPKQLSYPNSTTYEFEESQYWSQQQALTRPACRLSPNSADEISLAVLASRVTKCKFSVKSGGHAAFAGASNTEGGLTIDLVNLNEIKLSADKKQTSIGPGNVWYDVYSKLEPEGVTVIGGRVSAIGVGGLTLGGGISFFSSRHGWACDNINNYEVVFADGTIRDVNYSSYPDLYWALRGGGNNFGIVTRFDLATYPQGDLWAGSQTYIYNEETAAKLNSAVYYLGINAPSDPYAQVILAYAYAAIQGVWIIASDLQYGKPEPKPAILQNFTSVTGAIADTLRIASLTNLTQEFNATNPGGYRKTYWTFTVENDVPLMTEIIAIFMDEVERIKDAPGIIPSCIFQLITTDMTSHFSKNGGNALGLAGQGPLILMNIDIGWSNETDDKRVMAGARSIVSRSIAAAKAKGLHNQFLYQNYAALQQDVFPSYGSANYAKLKAVSRKYDPTGVWQKLQPGYFKL